MVTIMGTLGGSPDTFLPTIRSSEEVDRVMVFRGADGESSRCARKVRGLCDSLEIEYDERVLEDTYDMMGMARAIQDCVREHSEGGHRVATFNIAGGSKLMSGAAMFVCAVEGLNAVYVHDDTGEEIPLPLVKINYHNYLTEVEKYIIRFLVESEGKMSQKDICEGLGLHKATVNHHIRMLIAKGVVHLEPREGDHRIKDVHLEEGMELLLEVLA